MHIKATFADLQDRDSFAKKWNLSTDATSNELVMSWNLYTHLLTMGPVAQVEQLDHSSHEFIVQGKNNTLDSVTANHTVLQELGDGWFLVGSDQGVLLGSEVEHIEHNKVALDFVFNHLTVYGFGNTLDPLGEDAQWARIRVASRYRPLLEEYATHEVKRNSKPEIYIMDTGINFDHVEFDYANLEKVDFYSLPVFEGNFRDDLGHGTAVASMAVGKNLSVAHHATVMNIKIGGVVAGVMRTASLFELGQSIDAILSEISTNPNKTRIVNMSWGTTKSTWLDSKVLSLIDAGAVVVCAAGNSGVSVDDITPAGIKEVITVGAIDKYDIPAGYNNIAPSDSGLTTADGLSLDLFAPGDQVVVAVHSQNSQYGIASGTSLASPLVCGVAAEIASMNEGLMSHQKIIDIILSTAVEHALLFEDDRFSENQNRLLHLLTGDSLSKYKLEGAVSYLGIHGDNEVLVADMNSSLDVTGVVNSLEEPVAYYVELAEDSLEYAEYVSCDPVTGIITVTKPEIELPEETKLKMVNFIGVAENSKIIMKTNTIFFFHTNPLYIDTVNADVTLALTDVNSISFFQTWDDFGQLK